MDASVRSIGTRANTANVLAPPTVVVGDLILIEALGNITAPVACAGFTAIEVANGGVRRVTFLWKIADSGDVALSGSAGTYTLTGTTITAQVAYAIQDVDPAGPIRASTGAIGSTGTTTIPALSLSSLSVGDLLMWFVAMPGTTFTLATPPASSTRLLPTAAARIHATSLTQATAGTSPIFTATGSVSSQYLAGLIAIVGAPDIPAQIAVTFPKFVGSLTSVAATAALDVTFPKFVTDQTVDVTGNFLDTHFPVFEASLNVEVTRAQVAATFPKFTTSLTVALSVPTELETTFPKFRAALSGGVQSIVGIATTFPKFRVAISATTATAPTWQEVVRSEEYLTAAQAATRRVSARVEMVDDNELVVAAIPITGGNVSCDSTVDERWAATITLGDSDLMPSEVTDLLHPLSGLRARIWWTLELPSGLLAEVPIGTYYSSAPAATNNGSFGLTVKLLDVTSRIRRNKWGTGDVTDLGGMTVSAALRSVFTNRAPRFTVQITDTTETLPEVYEVGQVGRDPLSDILAIADAASYVVYSDRMGGLVAEPRGAVDDTRTVLDLSVGPDCRMESIQRSLDETQLLNTVTVRSTSSEVDPPVYATVQDNDPASPLWVGNGFIYSDVIDSDSVTTEAQCRALATVTLAERRALIESVDAVHRSRPEIDPLNLIDVNEPKTGASGVYQLASWSIDLEPGSMQRSTLTDRKVPV